MFILLLFMSFGLLKHTLQYVWCLTLQFA